MPETRKAPETVSPPQPLVGRWVGGTNLPNDAPYPTVQVNLAVTEAGGNLNGTFSARYKTTSASGESVVLPFNGTLAGSLRSAGRYEFQSNDQGKKVTLTITIQKNPRPTAAQPGDLVDVIVRREGENAAFEHVLQRSR